MIRTIEQWIVILKQDSFAHPEMAALRIFGDLIGYRKSAGHTDQDAKQLANAIAASILINNGTDK